MALEAEVAMRAVAYELASELLIEPPPPPPRPHHHPCHDLAAIGLDAIARHRGHRARLQRLRAGRNRIAEQEIIEQQPRDAARSLREVEFVRPMPADDAAPCDRRRIAKVDPESLDDREGVIRQKLATELVPGKRVAVDQRHGATAAGQKSGERRSGRARADNGDVYFHRSNPNRNGQARTTSAQRASTSVTIARTSSIVYPRRIDAGASFRVIRPTSRSMARTRTKR